MSAEEVAHAMYTMAHSHEGNNNILYRIFYYDCMPLEKKFHNPISKRVVDFSKTKECLFRKALFEELKKKRKVALRLGSVKENGQWQIYPAKVKELIKGDISVDDLTVNDVYLNIRQKSIDMKIGVDIASLSLKRFVDTIVLFSGDADFVPAAKLARREGVDFILDPMNANVDPQLFEHIDGMKRVIPPNTNNRKKQKQARQKTDTK
ncbi:MAG: NYN domain-containing protein [Bacteroidales bacterium]|nr:NYN domain-containing protein [Bacteroidales bacterium]